VDILLVSHFHWDREWYRTFEEFRGRLVDAVDAVLDLLDADPGYRFVLDGQAVVLEDYLAVRPEQRERVRRGITSGRLAAGPWYVQPDSLIPSGESHVRNLLIGRAVAGELGPVSRVAYVPDSFGHPAQFPQIFRGFGLDPFVYWRGNGDEIDALAPLYRWCAPDGSSVRAWYLGEGYFGAAGLDADDDPHATIGRLRPIVERLAAGDRGPVLLMNGFDHLPPDTRPRDVAGALGASRVLLDDAAARLPPADELPVFTGALVGARHANLLPGVWSARIPCKLRNRAIETLLTAWAEPWAAFGHALGLPDERPALRRAWRALLENQAHDSICGCSIDPVHERMQGRYDDAEGLGRATVQRVLERLGGRRGTRTTPWSDTQDVVVFNASPDPGTGVVLVPLDAFPPWRVSAGRFDLHPLALSSFTGLSVDGAPARLVPSHDPNRVRFLPGSGALDVEFVAHDVPAFGSRRYRLTPAEPVPDTVDGGETIETNAVTVTVHDDGTLRVRLGDRSYDGLFAIEDCEDRGDTYDADVEPPRPVGETVAVQRARHPSGIARLLVTRVLDGIGDLSVEATVAPGVPYVRCRVVYDNQATDHRLRLRFPTGAPVSAFTAATTFDAARRTTDLPGDARWVHRAPATFVHQGWIAANGLVVGAPGLPEAEVTKAGEILVTLARSVGVLARLELRTRPLPAGPAMPVPGAQGLGRIHATVTLAHTPRDAHAAELGLWGVLGGGEPQLAPGTSLLGLRSRACELSACKPAEHGDGVVVRIVNPTDTADDAELAFGVDIGSAVSVRLDEEPDDRPVDHDGRVVRLHVRAHELRTILVTPSGGRSARRTAQ
jgi:hypothetical protein